MAVPAGFDRMRPAPEVLIRDISSCKELVTRIVTEAEEFVNGKLVLLMVA